MPFVRKSPPLLTRRAVCRFTFHKDRLNRCEEFDPCSREWELEAFIPPKGACISTPALSAFTRTNPESISSIKESIRPISRIKIEALCPYSTSLAYPNPRQNRIENLFLSDSHGRGGVFKRRRLNIESPSNPSPFNRLGGIDPVTHFC
jgi:hypothetical protein